MTIAWNISIANGTTFYTNNTDGTTNAADGSLLFGFRQFSLAYDIGAGKLDTTSTTTVSFHIDPTVGTISGYTNPATYNSHTGTFSVTGNSTTIGNVLRGLHFTLAAGTLSHPGDSKVVMIDQIQFGGYHNILDEGFTVVNDTPVISNYTTGEQKVTGAVQPFGTIMVTDACTGQSETLLVTPSVATNGTLSSTAGGALDTHGNFQFQGTVDEVQTVLRNLTFTPTQSQNPSTTTFSVSVSDGASVMNTIANAATVSVGGNQNNPPVIGGSVPSPQIVNEGVVVNPFSSVTVSDVDGDSVEATVTLVGGTISYNGTSYTGNKQFTFSGTTDQVQAQLRSMTVTPSGATNASFQLSVFDGTDTISDTATILQINHAPTIISTAPASQTKTAGSEFTPFTGVTVGDTDSGDLETVRISIDDRSLGTLGGKSWTANSSGNGGYTEIYGGVANVNTILSMLLFTPPNSDAHTQTFTVSAIDQHGLSVASPATLTFSTQSVPVITNTQPSWVKEVGTSVSPFAHISIADATGVIETVTVTGAAAGSLTFGTGTTATYDSGVYRLTGTAAEVTAALEGASFTAVAGNTPFHIGIHSDLGQTGGTDVTVYGNSAPVIMGLLPFKGVTEGAVISPFASVAIVDESSDSETVTVITNEGGDDVTLQFGSFAGATRGSNGYSLTGSAGAVTTALRSATATFDQSATEGSSRIMKLRLLVTDGVNNSPVNSGTIMVYANPKPILRIDHTEMSVKASYSQPFLNFRCTDNDDDTETMTVTAPSATTLDLTSDSSVSVSYANGAYTMTGIAVALTTKLEGASFHTVDGSTTVFNISVKDSANQTDAMAVTVHGQGELTITNTNSDYMVKTGANICPLTAVVVNANASAMETVVVTASQGTLSFGTSSGVTDNHNGSYQLVGSAAIITAALQTATTTASADQTIYSITVTDSIQQSAQAYVTVTGNSVPSIQTMGSSQVSVKAGVATTPFALVSISHESNDNETMTVTAGQGTLDFGVNSLVTYDSTHHDYSLTGTRQTITTALQAAKFTAIAGSTTSFTIDVTDSLNQNAVSKVLTVYGNGVPSITNTQPNQTAIIGSNSSPFAHVSIQDDSNDRESVTVTAGQGTLTFGNTSGVTIGGNGSGACTLEGSVSKVTTALQGASWTAVAGSTSFVIQTTDSLQQSVSTTVTIKDGNHPPVITNTSTAQSVSDNATLSPFSAVNITDTDATDTETVSVSLSDVAHGMLGNLGAFTYNNQTGKYTISGAASAVTNALHALTFIPTANRLAAGSSESTLFTIEDNDGYLSAPVSTSVTVQTVSSSDGGTTSTPTYSTQDYSTDTSGRETNLTGNAPIDVTCGSGDDVVRGNSGNNVLNGSGGNNQLWGATGNDTLIGGSGSNAFWVGNGDGQDIVEEASVNSRDALYLYNVSRDGFSGAQNGNSLVLTTTDGSSVTLDNWYTKAADERIQGFVFGNTVVAWNNGAEATVNLFDPCYTLNQIHTAVAGDTGYTILRGSSGDDSLTEGNGGGQLWGAGGNDTMIGGTGSNAFWFGNGDGQDIVEEASVNSRDALYLYNVSRDGYSGAQNGNSLVLTTTDGSSVTLDNWYTKAADERIQGFVFGNTVVAWNNGEEATVNLFDSCYALNNIHSVVVGDGGYTMLLGSIGDDTITSGSGGGQMWGSSGNDVLTGGNGVDTYWWRKGDGNDVIVGEASNSLDSVMLYNQSIASISSHLNGNDLVISLNNDSADTLTVQNWAQGGGYQLNSFIVGKSTYHVAVDGATWQAS